MNYIFSLIFLLSSSVSIKVFGQIEKSFLKDYNKHIDPANRIDSLTKFSFKMSIDATAIINSSPFEIHNFVDCIYFANGNEQLIDGKSATSISADFIPKSRKKFKNALKDRIGLINYEESTDLKLKYLNDSITVIEERINDFQVFTYTFNSKTKDLMQIENSLKNESRTYHSFTTFLNFQTINRVLVPYEINFINDFAKANVKFLNPSLE